MRKKILIRRTLLVIRFSIGVIGTLNAQVSNTGQLNIGTGSNINIVGDFSNESTATYTNNGDAYFQGSFTNDQPAMAAGVGTTTFNGTSAQIIRGAQVSNFHNLTVNKSAMDLTLNKSITTDATGILTLTAGKTAINKNTITVNNDATGAIARTAGYLYSEDATLTGSKANNSSYVTWAIGSTTGAHVFPFGKSATEYIPFTYDLSSGTIGNLTVATYASAANNTPMPIGVNHVNDTLASSADNSDYTVDRYWHISSTTAATGSMTFTYADAEAPFFGESGSDGKGLRAQQWNGFNSWAYDNDPTVGVSWIAYYRDQTPNAAANSVTVNGFATTLNTSMPWTLALHAHPLPVKLISFKAYSQNRSVSLKWKTASEVNNSHFVLKRSTMGTIFESIATVAGNGNSTIQHDYSYVDNDAPSGIVYYQLSQVDFDGSVENIGIVSVEITDDQLLVTKFYPIPSKENLSYEISSMNDCNALVEIYSISGALKMAANIVLHKGVSSGYLDLDELGNGSYFVKISGKEIMPRQHKISILK